MKPEQLLQFYSENVTKLDVAFKDVNSDKMIATGVVYVPDVLDTHDEMMLAADVELMAHRFMGTLKNNQIDLMHNNRLVKATAVESFIVCADHPIYPEGAWVLSIKIEDPELWADIKCGKFNGFSVETFITKIDAIVELTFNSQVFGLTEKADGHEHYFFIQVDDDGRIVGGTTSAAEDGHVHSISFGTATDMAEKHAHRFALP